MPPPWTRRYGEMAAKIEQEERLTFRQVVEHSLRAVVDRETPLTVGSGLAERVAEDLKRRLATHGYAVHDVARCVRPPAAELGREMTEQEIMAVGLQ